MPRDLLADGLERLDDDAEAPQRRHDGHARESRGGHVARDGRADAGQVERRGIGGARTGSATDNRAGRDDTSGGALDEIRRRARGRPGELDCFLQHGFLFLS